MTMNSMQQRTSSHSIILFDGMCNLCNWFVRFIIGHDKKDIFRFGMLQSEKGRELLKGIPSEGFDLTTTLLLNIDRVDNKSDAVLKILRTLGGVWSLFYLFVIMPRSIRDGVYRFISRYRYHIFGKRQSCLAVTPEELKKFI